MAYRFYMSDCLYALTHNGAMNMKYSELLDHLTKNTQYEDEEKDGVEIVNELMAKHGLRFE